MILDLTMRDERFEALREILRHSPETKVLVLTMHDAAAYGRSLLAAGASGYVTKKAADRELLLAIRTVREGRPFVDVTQAEEMLPSTCFTTPKYWVRTRRSPNRSHRRS